MATDVAVRWELAQDALRNEVHRVTALLRSVRDPAAPAVGKWNLAETAMHLSQAWLVVLGLARQDLSGIYEVIPGLAGTAGDSLICDMWELGDVTNLGVRSDPERNCRVLADRIEVRAEEFFKECAGRSAEEICPWLVEGSTVRLSTLTSHLLNETVVHAYDIARADERTWQIERPHAAMVLEEFIVPVIQALPPGALVSDKAAGLQATYDLHIRGGRTFQFVFDNKTLRVEEPSSRGVDCHISADPAAFLTELWGRRSQWKAIVNAQLIAWGRRAWLGPQLRALLRTP